MMVPQPSRTLDLQRKEELILQKQIRQSTAKIKNNLPTLIEASPDFNSKKLPYLPYLPDSVQSQFSSYPPYDDTSESVVTDDLPSLYSVPHKLRSESRCSSITFDLTDAEGYNRNRSKSRNKRNNNKEKQKDFKEESQANIFAEESPTMQRSKPHSSKQMSFEKEEDEILSKWSCRKCTLENPLQEAVCMACGGSRLSSIGDIEVPRIVEPKNLVNLIKDEFDEELIEDEDNNNVKDLRWKCKVCTLENEPLNYYCDACNSPNPKKDEKERNAAPHGGNPVNNITNNDNWILISKIVRYVGIACFCLIILIALTNMVLSVINLFRTFLASSPVAESVTEELRENSKLNRINTPLTVTDVNKRENEFSRKISPVEHNTETQDNLERGYAKVITVTEFSEKSDIEKETNDPEPAIDNVANIEVDDSEDDFDFVRGIFFETFGFLPTLFIIYWPLFLFLVAKICNVAKISQNAQSPSPQQQPRVAQPM